jgi:hypothetical protein
MRICREPAAKSVRILHQRKGLFILLRSAGTMMDKRTPIASGSEDNEVGRRHPKDRFTALFRGLAKSKSRRYTIELRDAKSGALVTFTTGDWTNDEKYLAVAQIMRLASLPDGGVERAGRVQRIATQHVEIDAFERRTEPLELAQAALAIGVDPFAHHRREMPPPVQVAKLSNLNCTAASRAWYLRSIWPASAPSKSVHPTAMRLTSQSPGLPHGFADRF